jgi:type III pantothenate kinase
MGASFLLAIDSGNTAIKWGLHDSERWIAFGRVLQNKRQVLKQAWETLPLPESVVISNVAGKQAADDLATLLKQWQIQPYWITASNNQCGITNGYTEPEQLGCDRWAALIASWHEVQQACLVVDVGTAMTIDALSSTGQFLGGIILPGPDIMQRTLINHTNTFIRSTAGCFQNFPVNTKNALHSGTIQALCGALQRMHHLLSCHSEGKMPVEIMMTGGGATLLDQYISVPHRIIDNLVLEGLVIISQASRFDHSRQ